MSPQSHDHAVVTAREVLGPVCGMTISPNAAVGHIDHKGHTYYFCSESCLEQFRADPARFVVLQRKPPAAGAPPRDPARLPVVTYGMGDPVRLRMNGETVELIPVRAAHTGGDTIIRFVNADVIMIGDFYRNFGYPFIDANNGGSLKGALEGLELTMKAAGPNTRLIPGHGTYIKKTDIIPYRDMILGVQTRVQQLIAQGKTLQEVLAAKVTSPDDAMVPGGLLPAGTSGTSADRFVSMVYAQLKGQ